MVHRTSGSEKRTYELLVEAGLGLAVLAQIGTVALNDTSISGAWLVVGALVGIIILTAGRTDTGQQIGDWWEQIGLSGRFIGIVSMLFVVFLWIWFARPPRAPSFSFVLGLLGVVVISVIAQVAQTIWNFGRQLIT